MRVIMFKTAYQRVQYSHFFGEINVGASDSGFAVPKLFLVKICFNSEFLVVSALYFSTVWDELNWTCSVTNKFDTVSRHAHQSKASISYYSEFEK